MLKAGQSDILKDLELSEAEKCLLEAARASREAGDSGKKLEKFVELSRAFTKHPFWIASIYCECRECASYTEP